MATERPVRVGVIGTGWWATAAHLPALCALPGVEVVLCDRDPARLAAAATAFGVERTYADHAALLAAERPDALVVATTHSTHYALARDGLEAGAHVLVEKPLTLRAADARDLVERAAAKGRGLLSGYPFHYTERAQQVRALVRGGTFGAVQFVSAVFNSFHRDLLGGKDWTDRDYRYPVHGPGDVYSKKEHSGGGHGHLQLTHPAGLLFFVADLRVRTVQARMANHGLPVDLVDAILVDFENGALGMIGGTSNSPIRRLTLQIGCAEGFIDLDMTDGKALVQGVGGALETLPGGTELYPKEVPAQNLVAVARGEAAPRSDGTVGWRAVELLEAAYRSAAEEGRAVHVDELYEEKAS